MQERGLEVLDRIDQRTAQLKEWAAAADVQFARLEELYRTVHGEPGDQVGGLVVRVSKHDHDLAALRAFFVYFVIPVLVLVAAALVTMAVTTANAGAWP